MSVLRWRVHCHMANDQKTLWSAQAGFNKSPGAPRHLSPSACFIAWKFPNVYHTWYISNRIFNIYTFWGVGSDMFLSFLLQWFEFFLFLKSVLAEFCQQHWTLQRKYIFSFLTLLISALIFITSSLLLALGLFLSSFLDSSSTYNYLF